MASTTDVIDLTTERELEPELLDAIQSAKAPTLRNILIQLCKTSEICASHIEQVILVPKPQPHSVTANESTTGGSKKRKLESKMSRFAHCVQCKRDYDVILNEKPGEEQRCRRHDGDLEMKEDAFPDDDDIQYYGHVIDVNTDWRVDEFPEEFTWSCCEQEGRGAEPCLRSRHSKNGEGQGQVFSLVNGDFEEETDGDASESDQA